MFLRRLLVPVDFSERSEGTLAYAVGIARAAGAAIDLLHVLPAAPLAQVAVDLVLDRPIGRVSPEALREIQHAFNELLAQVDVAGVEVECSIEVGDAAATIVRVATEDVHDLIILGTRGRIGLSDLVLGSVAKTLITCAPCPVVTLRPTARAAAPHRAIGSVPTPA